MMPETLNRAGDGRRHLRRLKQRYQEKEDLVGPDVMRQTERIVMLQVIDNQWKDHLLSMDELKQGIGNRAYGRRIRWSSTRRNRSRCSRP